MIIHAQKGHRVVARKRKGGNATAAEVRSVSRVTFRVICHWALISSPFFYIFNGFSQELLHEQIAGRKDLTYFLFLKVLMLRIIEERLLNA